MCAQSVWGLLGCTLFAAASLCASCTQHREPAWSEQSDLQESQLDEGGPLTAAPEPSGGKVRPLTWESDLPAARKRAKRQDRLLLVWVHADWAVPSVHMKRELWTDAEVERALQPVVTVMIDVTAAEPQMDVRLDGLKVNIVPDVLVLRPNGSEVGRTNGMANRAQLLALIKRAASR